MNDTTTGPTLPATSPRPGGSRLVSELFAPVPIDWLVVYRLSFGTVMLWYAWKFLRTGAVTLFYVTPLHHFPYEGFRWVTLIDFPIQLNGQVYQFVYLEYVCLAVMAFLILIGLFYRFASIVFAICFAHLFLLDKCYYQNHYYLVCLLAWQLPFLPANRAFSVDAWLTPQRASRCVPAWTLWLIRFQVGVPYFFGGLAKFDADWLRGQPMRMSLVQKLDTPLLGGPWLEQEWCVQLVVWGGLLFDLLVVPGLLWKRTRALAFLLAIGFHLTNSMIWTIGIFPWLMILLTTVYFEPDWPRRLVAWWRRAPFTSEITTPWRFPSAGRQVAITTLLTAFVVWQCLLPLRYLVTRGQPNWDEYVHHFSWHMMLRAKECGLRIYATDPRTGRSGVVDLRSYVTARQLGVIARDPRMIHELCHFVAADMTRRGFPNVEIRALALVALNGRKPQPLIDPRVDLAARPLGGYPDYVVPLQEPYRHEAWKYPLAEWEQHLELALPAQMQLSAEPTSKQSTARSPETAHPESTSSVGEA